MTIFKRIIQYLIIIFSASILYIGLSIGISYIGIYNNLELGKSEGSSFVTIDHKNIAYRFTPASSSSWSGTILLIHGFAAWGKTWEQQELFFSEKGYDVYSLDLPPFGMTDQFEDYYFSRESQAGLIHAFIREKNLQNIILVAHSYGGKAALESYIQKPDLFSGMILLDVALGFPRQENIQFHKPAGVIGYIVQNPIIRENIMRFIFVNTYIGTRALHSFLYNPETLTPERLSVYKTPFRIDNKAENVGNWLAYTLTHPESGQSLDPDIYKNISIPTLIVWGKEDTITPIEQGRELHKMIPHSTLVELDRVNHIPQIEDPVGLHDAISLYLSAYQQ